MKLDHHNRLLAALALGALCATATPALAETYYWDSSAPLSVLGFGTTGGTWGTDARWVTSRAGTAATGISAPLISDDLNFGFEAMPFSNGTIAVNGTQFAKSLTFARRQANDAGSKVTLAGGTITLPADATILCTSSAITDTINSELAGAATRLTKAGTGILALGGLISYTGDTVVNAGTLQIASAATGSLNSAKALMLNGGTFTYSKTADAGQTLNGLTIGNGTSAVNNTAAGKILNLGAITRASGNGVLNFNSATGATGGIVTSTPNSTSGIIGPWATIGGSTSTRYAVANGASAITGLTGTTATAGTLENMTSATTNYEFLGAATTVDHLVGHTLRSTGTTANPSTSITIDPEKTLTLDGILNAGSVSSTLTISGGPATGGLLIGASGELVIASNSRSSSANSVVTISAVIAGTGGKLSFSSPLNTTWQFSLSGANTYTGGTFINNAQVLVNTAANLGTGPITFGGTEFMSQLRLAADVTWPQDMIVKNASLATFQGGFTATCTGNVSGDGGINAAGANGGAYVHLDGTNNTFKGPVIIGLYNTSLTFKYGVSVASLADSPTANGAIIIGGGSTVFSRIVGVAGPYFAYTGNTALTLDHRQLKVATTTSTSAFVINNSANHSAMTINTDLRVATEVTGNKILALGGTSTGPSTFGGKIANSPTGQLISVNKVGPGTWQLTNPGNTYTGNTTVTGGTLVLGALNTLPDTSPVSIGTASLDAAAAGSEIAGTLDVTAAATIKLAAGARIAFANSSAINWTGGTLDITGSFVSGTALRFGSSSGSLTPAQLALISVNGSGAGTCTLDSAGYLVSSSAYHSWATAKGLTGAPGFENAKAADPDGDGNNNLQEFAFDGDPLSVANDGKVVGKVAAVDGSQVLTLTLPVRSGAVFADDSGDELSALIDDICYRIEGSTNLITFADDITEVTGTDATTIQTGLPMPLSTGWTYRTFRVSGTVLTQPKAFLRAKISETP